MCAAESPGRLDDSEISRPVIGEQHFSTNGMRQTMRFLALETSGTGGSVATYEPGRSPRVVRIGPSQRSAAALAPAVRSALADAEWRPRDVQVIGVTVGPGSFTGLRIGVTTAKTLAYALGADVVGVDTSEVIARQANVRGTTLWTLLDAHRSQLFVGRFLADPAEGSTHATAGPRPLRRDPDVATLWDVDEWLGAVRAGDVVSGPIVGRLKSSLPPGVILADEATWEPDAGTVALLAAELYDAGRRDDVRQLVPQYGRLPAAEEKRLAGNP